MTNVDPAGLAAESHLQFGKFSSILAGSGMKFIWICLFLEMALWAPAADVVVPGDVSSAAGPAWAAHGQILRLQIQLEPTAAESLRVRPRRWVSAVVQVEGRTYREVGLHLKGSSGSFRPLDEKPGLTLDFGRFVPEQRLFGGRRVHLNNGVQDPSYLSERLGSELFRGAGIPTAQTGHAVVALNGRPLGLYVLQEGFTSEFFSRHFSRGDGHCYEMDGAPAESPAPKGRAPRAPVPGSRLAELGAAITETDLQQRWERLEKLLDLNQFLTFMVLEVMFCHHDGYSLARNNFRIYDDPGSGRFVFLPQGMDQLFAKSDYPWNPVMGGAVARAVMEVPEGRRRYEERFRALLPTAFRLPTLEPLVKGWLAELRPFVSAAEFRDLSSEAARMEERIRLRKANLERQLAEPAPGLLVFAGGSEGGSEGLTGWKPVDVSTGTGVDRMDVKGVPSALHIMAGPHTGTSWRARALLPEGSYRFAGRASTRAAEALPFGRHQGAGLRIGGAARTANGLVGDQPWRSLEARFEIHEPIAEVEFICEFRAGRGEAWFDPLSLRVEKLP